MLKFGKQVVKLRIPILIISLLLLIPTGIIYLNTRINYDILSYLPEDIDTMKGQDILVDEFGTGAFSIAVIDGMSEKQIEQLETDISKIDHVKNVFWYGTITDLTIPIEALPEDARKAIISEDGDKTIMMIMFDTASSADETLSAIEQIRDMTQKQCLLGGMSAVVEDIKLVCNSEAIMYIVIAAVLSLVVLSLTMDSFLIPLFFLASIGMAIVYNLGTNFVKGEISFITQALAAVLQLAVTMDYSIFLWHSYQEYLEKYNHDKNRAMAHAISNTVSSVVGSSITTVAGFVAMCFMTFTLGLDLGIVMAKGVIFGVIGCVTILPSMILVFDNAIEKTKHKPLIPDLGKIGKLVTNKYIVFIVMFLLILFPAFYGYKNNKVYYDLAGTLPEKLESVQGNKALENEFNMGATHMILANSKLSTKNTNEMINKIKELDGVKLAVGLDSITGSQLPKEFLPSKISKELISDNYKLIMIASEYKTASDEVNAQIDSIKDIVAKYDDTAMVIGEAPCTQDLITITDKDFKTVSTVSIALIFVIIAMVLKSVSLPIILVAVIEFAIFINMAVPFYMGTTIPFISSIVIGTIQLGATVDYAILMTNKYKKARYTGSNKKEAITYSLETSLQSVFVSALTFFAATFGVGLYSSIDMISSLCSMLARGAIISFFVVALVLPAMFMVFDGIIINTSLGFKNKKSKMKMSTVSVNN